MHPVCRRFDPPDLGANGVQGAAYGGLGDGHGNENILRTSDESSPENETSDAACQAVVAAR